MFRCGSQCVWRLGSLGATGKSSLMHAPASLRAEVLSSQVGKKYQAECWALQVAEAWPRAVFDVLHFLTGEE